MTNLEKYVDDLFRHRRMTPELKDLKEEVLSNMVARQHDLIDQGFSEAQAAAIAMEALPAIDPLIDGEQLTDMGQYHEDCYQVVLLHSLIYWILSMPLLFTSYAVFSELGLVMVVLAGAGYLRQKRNNTHEWGRLSLERCDRRRKTAWLLWSLFFLVDVGIMLALTFASDVWFGRPLTISGPYEAANVAVRFYLPLLTMLVPLTFARFPQMMVNNRKGYDDE